MIVTTWLWGKYHQNVGALESLMIDLADQSIVEKLIVYSDVEIPLVVRGSTKLEVRVIDPASYPLIKQLMEEGPCWWRMCVRRLVMFDPTFFPSEYLGKTVLNIDIDVLLGKHQSVSKLLSAIDDSAQSGKLVTTGSKFYGKIKLNLSFFAFKIGEFRFIWDELTLNDYTEMAASRLGSDQGWIIYKVKDEDLCLLNEDNGVWRIAVLKTFAFNTRGFPSIAILTFPGSAKPWCDGDEFPEVRRAKRLMGYS